MQAGSTKGTWIKRFYYDIFIFINRLVDGVFYQESHFTEDEVERSTYVVDVDAPAVTRGIFVIS